MSSPERRVRFDWEAARERMARSAEALERAFVPDPGLVRETLQKRAARLARAPESAACGDEIQVLVLSLGAERYAIDIGEVAGVLPHPVCVPVPGGPAALRGVMQFRGEICPVWDLARLLVAGESAAAGGHVVLVLRQAARPVAVAVTAVQGVHRFRLGEFAPAPATLSFVKGLNSDLIALLDVGRIVKEAVQ